MPAVEVWPHDGLVTNDDFAILAAVAAEPSHPYRLLDHLGALGISIPRSSLYRRVDLLVAGGLLTTERVPGKNGHARRRLALTGAGWEQLATMAAGIVRREPLASPRFALAIACGGALDAASLADVLRRRMATAARLLTAEERRLAAMADAPFWERASQERRVAHLKADLQWLQAIRAHDLPRPNQQRKETGHRERGENVRLAAAG